MVSLMRAAAIHILAGLGFLSIQPAASAQLMSNGFTYSRQQGISTSSSSKTVVLGVSRALDDSCRQQVQDWYREQGLPNAAGQGCITQPSNVFALPIRQGRPNQYKIMDKDIEFGVAERTVSSYSDSINNQKTVTGFTGFGYSVFVNPQN